MKSLVNRWSSHPRFFILSAKDSPSIAAILSHNRINMPFERIYGDPAGDKPVMMANLLEHYGLESALFVDDHPGNLMPFVGGRVTPCLAQWGYALPGVAVQGVESLTIHSLESLLEQWLGTESK